METKVMRKELKTDLIEENSEVVIKGNKRIYNIYLDSEEVEEVDLVLEDLEQMKNQLKHQFNKNKNEI